MSASGLDLIPREYPVIPVRRKWQHGCMTQCVYVAPFNFPILLRGQDRIRIQLSAAHSHEELDRAIDAFIDIGSQMRSSNE